METTRRRNSVFKFWIIILLVLLIQVCSGKQRNKKYYMDQFPSYGKHSFNLPSTTTSDSAIMLKVSDYKHPKDGLYAVTINPPEQSSDYFIAGWVRKFDIRGSRVFGCDDILKIINVSPTNNQTIYSGCTSNIPRRFKLDPLANFTSIVFELKLNGYGKTTFEIILTTLRNGNGNCRSYEFGCSNSYCINEGLTCDDADNCGDSSDETTKSCKRTMNLGLSIGGAIVIIIIVAIGFALCRRRYSSIMTTRQVVIPSQSQPYTMNQPATTPLYPGQVPYNGNPYPTGQMNSPYPVAQVNPGYPVAQMNPSYPDGQVNPNYPVGQVNPAYPGGPVNPPYPTQGQVPPYGYNSGYNY